MSARSDLTAALAARLTGPAWRFVPYATTLDRIEAGVTVVMVYQTNVVNGPARSLNRTMQIQITTGKGDPGAADDVLDEALEDVLVALNAINPALFQSAERGTFQDDTYAAYRVEVQFTTIKE